MGKKLKKSEILKKVKEFILDNDLEDVVELSNDVLIINKDVKTKFKNAIEFCNQKKMLYKTNKYYELIRDFGGEIIQNTVFRDDDLVFYSHFANDSIEANDEVEHQIKCAITDFFFTYKKDSITYENERIISNYMKEEINDRINPYDLGLLSRIGCLFNDIIDISSDLIDIKIENINANVTDEFTMIEKMLADIGDLLSDWAEIIGCHTGDIYDYDEMKKLYDKCLAPKYEKDLRKVLSINNIKNALIKYSNEKDDLFMKSLEYVEETGMECPISKILKQDLGYGLPSVDEIFNSNKGKVKIKK